MKKILIVVGVLIMFLMCSCISEYEVKFIGLDDEVIQVVSVKKGQSIIYPDAPIKEGYNFTGWDKVVEHAETNMVIRAEYEIIKYVVNFYDNNNSIIKTVTINYNESVTAPEAAEIEGFIFIGWDRNLSNIKENLDVKPIYNQINCIVKFYDDLGNVISEQTVPYGKSAEAVEPPAKQGHIFMKWDTDFTDVKTNLDIYPIYEEKYYEVTFTNFYNEVISVQTIRANSPAIAPTLNEVPYHTFQEWDSDLLSITSDITIKPIYTKSTDRYLIQDVNYWLRLLAAKYDINKTLLSAEEIIDYNSKITSNYAKTKVVDVTKLAGSKNAEYVKALISNYSNINSNSVFNCDTRIKLTTTEINKILENRNLSNVPAEVIIKYGIIVDFAWLRSYPTNHYSKDYGMDRFQETSLNVGEAVAIYHESLDGNWYFVQATNYNGWVEKKYVAQCSYDEMEKFLNPSERLVVISDYVIIENAYVRMGQAFPLIDKDNKYIIKFPTRNSDGILILKEISLAQNTDYSVGYLDYTYENIFRQAFKLLGITYSWGDKEKEGRDCSSTMNAIYNTFGFMMPRNTNNQEAIPSYGQSISNLTIVGIKTYKPGTLIFTSSHVMMYIGESESGAPYLLHNTNSGDAGCILQSFAAYGPSKISAVLRLQ